MMLLLSQWLEVIFLPPPQSLFCLFVCFLLFIVHLIVKDALSDFPYPDVHLARSHLYSRSAL